jgi:hypothetical protein
MRNSFVDGCLVWYFVELVMNNVAVLCVTVARAGTFALVRHIPSGNTWYRAGFVVFKRFLHL